MVKHHECETAIFLCLTQCLHQPAILCRAGMPVRRHSTPAFTCQKPVGIIITAMGLAIITIENNDCDHAVLE